MQTRMTTMRDADTFLAVTWWECPSGVSRLVRKSKRTTQLIAGSLSSHISRNLKGCRCLRIADSHGVEIGPAFVKRAFGIVVVVC